MNKSVFVLVIGCQFFLTACITLYKPNPVHSPLLTTQGELNASASLGLSGNGLYNLDIAWSPKENFGVMADAMYHVRNSGSDPSGTEKLNIYFTEAGAGYYTYLNNAKHSLFQCYGGGGWGSSSDKIFTSGQPNPEVHAKYYSAFVQPGIGGIHENTEVAFDVRVNYVRLYDIHAYLYENFEFWNTDFHYYSDTSLNFVNMEPALTFKAGGENLKALIQAGVILPVYHSNSYFNINNSSYFLAPLFKFSLGINYTLNTKKKNRSDPTGTQ